MCEHCRALFHFLSTKWALKAQKTGDAPSTKSLKNEHYLHRPSLFMCFKPAPMQGRHLPSEIRHQRWCWRLVWVWKCDCARTPIMLTLWDANKAHGQSFADFLRWVFFQVDMIYDQDLHTFFSRFQIQSNEKFGSAIATSCHMHVRDSNFTKSDRGTW